MAGEREGRDIPDWVLQERKQDLEWITENKASFWPAAQGQFQTQGRGVVVVDTTQRPDPNAGHPMYYLTQEMIEQMGDADVQRMLREYEPQREFVVTLLKTEERTSTYRVMMLERVQRGRPKRG